MQGANTSEPTACRYMNDATKRPDKQSQVNTTSNTATRQHADFALGSPDVRYLNLAVQATSATSSGSKWLQVARAASSGTRRFKWLQVAPCGSKWCMPLQVALSGSKWHVPLQVAPSSKWHVLFQVAPSGSKWLQVALVQAARAFQFAPSILRLFKWIQVDMT